MIAYLNGEFREESEIHLSPYERGFQFADGAYEVSRYYVNDYFKFDDHLDRLKRSLLELRINVPDLAKIKNAIYSLAEKNYLTNKEHLAYIQVTRGAFAPRRHYFPPENVEPTVYISLSLFKMPEIQINNGAKVILTEDIRWARCDIKSIALLPNVLARQEAIDKEGIEAIFVRNGRIMEGTHTNFCCIKNKTLITPPLSNFILAGITRGIVLEICKELEITFTEAPIKKSTVYDFDECMIVGTTTDVTPVIQINEKKIGNRLPGPVTRQIQAAFSALTSAS